MIFQRYETRTFTPQIPCISDEDTDIVLTNTILSTDVSNFTNIFELVFMSGTDLSLGDLQSYDPPTGGYYGIDVCSSALLTHIRNAYENSTEYTASYPNIGAYPSSQLAANPLIFNENRRDFIYDFGGVLRDVNTNITEFKSVIVNQVLIDSVRKITRSTFGTDAATLAFANKSISDVTPIGMQLRIVKNRVTSLLDGIVSSAPSTAQAFVDNMDILRLNHQKRRNLLINMIDAEMISIYTPYNTDGIAEGVTFGNEYYKIINRGSVSFSMSLIGGTSVKIALLPDTKTPTIRSFIEKSYSVQDICNGIAYPQKDGYSPFAASGCGDDIRKSAITFPVGLYYNDTLNISGGSFLNFPIRIMETDTSNDLSFSPCAAVSIPPSTINTFKNLLVYDNLGVGPTSYCNGFARYNLDVQGDAHVSRNLFVDGDISVNRLNYVTLNPPIPKGLGSFYKSTFQPAWGGRTDISWNMIEDWTDSGFLELSSDTTNFICRTPGVYELTSHCLVSPSGQTWVDGSTSFFNIRVTRPPGMLEAIFTGTVTPLSGQTFTNFTTGIIKLLTGDIVSVNINRSLSSAGEYKIQGTEGGIDRNTFFQFHFLRP